MRKLNWKLGYFLGVVVGAVRFLAEFRSRLSLFVGGKREFTSFSGRRQLTRRPSNPVLARKERERARERRREKRSSAPGDKDSEKGREEEREKSRNWKKLDQAVALKTLG